MVSTNKEHANAQIVLIEDDRTRAQMHNICRDGQFPFTYDGEPDANQDPGHDIKDFTSGRRQSGRRGILDTRLKPSS